MKKILAFVLVLATLLSLASCAATDPSAPDGYKLASNDEYCEYRLYIPTAWNAESVQTNFTTASVTVGENKCTVSVAELDNSYYANNVSEYFAQAEKEYGYLQNFTVEERDAQATLGSGEGARTAMRYVFTGDYNGTSYRFQQVFAPKDDGSLFCITYTATATYYAEQLETFNNILMYFSFK